mgnify:CR=1 FL=1
MATVKELIRIESTGGISFGDYELKENYYEYYHELKNLNLSGFKLIKIILTK